MLARMMLIMTMVMIINYGLDEQGTTEHIVEHW